MKKVINRIWTSKVSSLRVLLGIPMIYEVISTCLSYKYFKFNLFKTDLSVLSHLTHPVVFPISINSNSILQVFWPKTSELTLTPSVFSHSTLNASRKPSLPSKLIQNHQQHSGPSYHYLSAFLHSLYLLHKLNCNCLLTSLPAFTLASFSVYPTHSSQSYLFKR